MTLVKRGALAGMQVYISVPWAKKPITFRNPPPWVGKVENLSLPQLMAAYSLAKAAHEYAYGQTGKAIVKGVSMPIGAWVVQQSVKKGVKAHGGKTYAERAEMRHVSAKATLAYLESLIKAKGGTPPAVEAVRVPT